MKDGIHPNYRVNTKEMVKMDDGRELPLYKLDTSSESHPFYTGTQKSVDNMGGRVERFRNRFGKTPAKTEATAEATAA
jgi:large subunit ribosomal protein L31